MKSFASKLTTEKLTGRLSSAERKGVKLGGQFFPFLHHHPLYSQSPPSDSFTMLSAILASSTENCPTSAPFFGFMGVTAALVFANIGAGKKTTHELQLSHCSIAPSLKHLHLTM